MRSRGQATWHGTWKEGAGTLSTGTAIATNLPFSFASRFEGAPGASPEELLAVAQAGCFNQALANNIGMLDLVADQIETVVEIDLVIEEHPMITRLHVIVAAKVPGMTGEQFAGCAERARTNCTIAKLLKRELTMTASLEA